MFRLLLFNSEQPLLKTHRASVLLTRSLATVEHTSLLSASHCSPDDTVQKKKINHCVRVVGGVVAAVRAN